jgi:hypothetical protein
MSDKEMTDDHINKLIAEKLGLGFQYSRKPIIFTENAKVLLGELKEKDYKDYGNFVNNLPVEIQLSYDRGMLLLDIHYHFVIEFINTYILNPRLLCEKYLEWEGKQIFCGKCEAKSENTI